MFPVDLRLRTLADGSGIKSMHCIVPLKVMQKVLCLAPPLMQLEARASQVEVLFLRRARNGMRLFVRNFVEPTMQGRGRRRNSSSQRSEQAETLAGLLHDRIGRLVRAMVLALFLFRCTVFGAATLEPGASEAYCRLVAGRWRAPEPSECLIRLCKAWWKLQQLKFGGAKGAP